MSAVACSFLILVCGCTTTPIIHRQYSGGSRSPAEVAIITTQHEPIFTSKINGENAKVDKGRLINDSLGIFGKGLIHMAMNSYPKAVEVLPGKITLEVNYSKTTGRSGNTIYSRVSKYPLQLTFDARAGRAYSVDGREEDGNWIAFVVDITDKGSNVVCSASSVEHSSMAEAIKQIQMIVEEAKKANLNK